MVPTVLDVFMDRPAILTPLVDRVGAITANWGAGPSALLDVLFGESSPQGALPFDLPSSMAAVEANLPDVPFDLADIAKVAGLGARVQPAIEGTFAVKQTDKQDTLISRYAFFAPETKPETLIALQQDKTLVRPRDTLAVSSFNAGYITADLYPRMQAILQKIENDLREAQKAGEEQKAKKEQKAKEAEPVKAK